MRDATCKLNRMLELNHWPLVIIIVCKRTENTSDKQMLHINQKGTLNLWENHVAKRAKFINT